MGDAAASPAEQDNTHGKGAAEEWLWFSSVIPRKLESFLYLKSFMYFSFFNPSRPSELCELKTI